MKTVYILSVVFRSFVKELHEQLVSCMNHFTDELQKFQSAEMEKIRHRDELLRKEMGDALQIVNDIELLMQSPSSISVGGRHVIGRCDEFFKNCIDSNQCEVDFSYLDFMPAGRLYVKNEHLGFFRLCDAMPDDVELTLESSEPVVCNREYTVLIKTNHSHCTNAEPNLDVQLCDGQGGPVTFRIVNNNNGSYGVVFVPCKAGTVQVNVRLFGITVSSSPLEILVADEIVTPKCMPDLGAATNDSAGSSFGWGTSTGRKSGMSAESLRDSPSGSSAMARGHATPPVEDFDNGEYFAIPQFAVRASPASAMPSTNQDLSVPNDHNYVEEIRGSLMRMNVHSANGSGDYRVPSPSVGASSANGACLGSVDWLDNELDSPGLNLQLPCLYRSVYMVQFTCWLTNPQIQTVCFWEILKYWAG